jgi:hypothetical protein
MYHLFIHEFLLARNIRSAILGAIKHSLVGHTIVQAILNHGIPDSLAVAVKFEIVLVSDLDPTGPFKDVRKS